MTLLEHYNSLRVSLNMPPMRVWASGQDKLKKAITALEERLNGDISKMSTEEAKEVAKTSAKARKALDVRRGKVSEAAKDHASAEYDKEVKRTKAKAAATEKEVIKGDKDTKMRMTGGVKLAVICERLGMEPRAARVKLRAAYEGGGKGLPETLGETWVWASNDVKAVEALLKG